MLETLKLTRPTNDKHRLLFIDLEETVIDDFTAGLFLRDNKKVVENLCRSFRPTSIGVFSYALYGSPEREDFKTNMLPRLENFLEISLDQSFIPTVEEMMAVMCRLRSFQKDTLSHLDFVEFYNKEITFEYYVRSLVDKSPKPIEHACLLDDSVSNKTILHNNALIETIRVS